MLDIEEKRNLGIKFFEEKDFIKSSEIFNDIIKQKKTDHSAWFFLGKCERELKKYDAAIEYFENAIDHFLDQHPANDENKSNRNLRSVITAYQNSLAVTYQYKKEWAKALEIFFNLLKGQRSKYVLNSLGYTYSLMAEEEIDINKNKNLGYVFDLQSLYFYEQADLLMYEEWRNQNQRLINEAKNAETHSENWEKDFIKKRKKELYESELYGVISYNLCEKSFDLKQYFKVLEFGVDALKNIGEKHHFFKSIYSLVQQAKLVIDDKNKLG